MSFRNWIHTARQLGASDLHVEAGTPLVARVRGELLPVGETASAPELARLGQELLGAAAWPTFKARGSADISIVVAGTPSRINRYKAIPGLAIAIRPCAPAVSDLRA